LWRVVRVLLNIVVVRKTRFGFGECGSFDV
jgi:hypothetical protein